MGFTRKYLSGDGLVAVVRNCLRREKFEVVNGSEYSWQDCLMSGLAIFGFKCPSLLQFEKRKTSEPTIHRNLRTLYQVQMRRVIPVSESALMSYHRSSYATLSRRFFLICSAEKHLNRLGI